MPSRISPAEARSLLEEWVQSASLRRHCLAVASAMHSYAERGGHDEELWFVTGLLHDADYERFPDMDDAERLQQRQHRADVLDLRDVADNDLVLGQDRGGEDRKGTVLVAGRNDGAGQRGASVDDELLHEGAPPGDGNRAGGLG